MKWSFATIGIILLGLIGVAVIILFQNVTTNNENDYYLLKEVTEAAMIDAIDIPYYRETGDLKIVTEKFVENFTRRFAESTIFVTNEYTINFYDIIETPPKVSVVINTDLGEYTINGNSDEYGIANKLDAILEYVGEKTYLPVSNNPFVDREITLDYYAIVSNGSANLSLKIPRELQAPNISNIKIDSVIDFSVVNTQGELGLGLLKNELSYNNVKTDYWQTINNFSTSLNNITGSFYNCSRKGTFEDNYKCDDKNNYYVSINGSGSGQAMVKYKIKWTYDEYEFKD